jgi:ferrochelatase
MTYDALVVLSFGGPEGPDDVMPFLANVTRGRDVPRARLEEVAARYLRFGGVSPINAATRALVAAVAPTLDIPVYWGNRNWQPYLADTVAQMAADGVRRAACFVTSAYSGYSACDQYLEDIAAARAVVGARAPAIDKLRPFFDHPGFVQPFVDAATASLGELPAERRDQARLVFTAHSVPVAQAGADEYVRQVEAASRRVASAVPGDRTYTIAWQSRSGPPHVPWLEPDIGPHLGALAEAGAAAVVIVPVGFVADHFEVIWDLDIEALGRARELGLPAVRAATPGTHPAFVAMVGELVRERGRGFGATF